LFNAVRPSKRAAFAGRIVALTEQEDFSLIEMSHDGRCWHFQWIPSGQGVEALPEAGDIVEFKGNFTGTQLIGRCRVLTPSRIVPDAARSAQELRLVDIAKRRSQGVRAVRSFFERKGFLEVDTPALLAVDEVNPNIANFQTEWLSRGTRQRMTLHSSPELCMKRLLVAGVEKIFQLCHFYRNDEHTPLHQPEFLGLEFYQAFADGRAVQSLTERLVVSLARACRGGRCIKRHGRRIDLRPPWIRISMRQLILDAAGVDISLFKRKQDFARALSEIGIYVTPGDSFEDLIFKVFLERVERNLGWTKPVVVTDYPFPMAAFARTSSTPYPHADRFEIYIGGIEVGNGYTELTDPVEQRRRLSRDYQKRYPATPLSLDEQFLSALERGMPPAGGIAIGLDRLLMLLFDADEISDVIPFPHQPPVGGENVSGKYP